MKKIGIAVLVILAVLIGLKTCQAQIGERLFKRMVEQRLTQAPAERPDGLHVVLVGTGSPLADPSRAGPSTAIMAGTKTFIIDSGGGSVRNLGRFGVPPGRIDGVFLTHFHSDHIDGLGELMLQRWVNRGGRDRLPVYGPDGVEEIVEGLNLVYRQDRDYRVAHHGKGIVPPSGYGGTAMAFDGTAETVLMDEGGLKITAFPVHHEPVSPAVGYRFDYKGRSVSLTGDTDTGPGLAAAMKGSDIIISEALNADMVGFMEETARRQGEASMAKILSDIPTYHITPVEAAQLATEAEAEMLVFSHIVPILPRKFLYAYFLQGTGDKFSGEIIVGEDGMVFSLPAGSEAIETKK